MQQDLDQIVFSKSLSNIPLPKFHFETIVHREEVINNDLGPNDLEINIIECKHIDAPPDYNSLSLYIKGDFPFPDNKNPQQFTSPNLTITGPPFCPQIDFKKIFKIDRKKFVRFYKRGKLTLSLFHVRGFLRKDLSLGSVEVRFAELENNCESTLALDIMDGRKDTGGKVHIQLKIREPMEEKQYNEWSEKRLIIDKHYTLEDIDTTVPEIQQNVPQIQQNVPQPITNSLGQEEDKTNNSSLEKDNSNNNTLEVEITIEENNNRNTPEIENTKQTLDINDNTNTKENKTGTDPKQDDNRNTISQKPEEIKVAGAPDVIIPVSETTEQEVLHSPPQENTVQEKKNQNNTEELQGDPNSVDWIVSHIVMEDEEKRVKKQILDLKKEGKETDDEEVRLQIIATKIQVLMIQIETGLLTMEAYVEVVNKKIAEEEKYAKYFYKKGDKETAKRCLYRMKLMKQELNV